MRYTEEMMLQSKSGFCMPFEERGKDVELTLGYGKQKHPVTGTVFFHHGLDFEANHYLLSALPRSSKGMQKPLFDCSIISSVYLMLLSFYVYRFMPPLRVVVSASFAFLP